jgi:predicted Zn-dependent protease with MMP-like domain
MSTHPGFEDGDAQAQDDSGADVPESDAEALEPLDIAAEPFEQLVVDELDELPDDMVDGLDNIVFVVEDRPEDGSLDLLGLYDGVALTERGQYGFGEMPDRIVLYREPLLAISRDLNELRDQIHVTLVHEIAHFYGIDDEKLHELGWG